MCVNHKDTWAIRLEKSLMFTEPTLGWVVCEEKIGLDGKHQDDIRGD